ncbi:MAG: Gfo/Idh/MocA family protein [Promethearchaeota archaeon]
MKIGIIGCGVIFDLNVLGYLGNNDAEIVSLCDRRLKNVQEKIQKFNLNPKISIYKDYKEMLDNEELDIVEVLLPHHLHHEVTIYAAQKDLKGISVQKPMATCIKDCEEMIEVCKNNKIKLKIFENFCFYPPIMKAKQLLEEGIIGEVNSIHIKTLEGTKGGWKIPTSTWNWRLNSETCGGELEYGSPMVFDDGFHKFWLALHFINTKIEKVYAWIDEYNKLDVPAYVMWKYIPRKDSGLRVSKYGTMEYNYAPDMFLPSPYYPEDEFISITGSKGNMWINQATAGDNIMSNSEIFPPIVIFKDGEIESFTDIERDWKYGFINSTKHFIDVIKNGGEPILSGEEGMYTVQFSLAAIVSSMEGREVSPDEIRD